MVFGLGSSVVERGSASEGRLPIKPRVVGSIPTLATIRFLVAALRFARWLIVGGRLAFRMAFVLYPLSVGSGLLAGSAYRIYCVHGRITCDAEPNK